MVRTGATLVGRAPVASLGLAADPAEFDRLVKQMWAGGEQTVVGLGRVIASRQRPAAAIRLDRPGPASAGGTIHGRTH